MASSCGCGPNPSPCCGSSVPAPRPDPPSFILGHVDSPIGEVPRLATRLTWRDVLGAWKVRWGIGRMGYKVDPGLYAVGRPDPRSPVLVTANYKLSLDALRRELSSLDAWVLVLDTHGINVWCAAGKGTFGTEELVHRIASTRLREVVRHRRLILPQLGAPGVAAHLVAKQTGFSVDYGPVWAKDLPAYLAADRHATPAMRRVTFNLRERLAVVPVEIVQAWKPTLVLTGLLALTAAIGRDAWGTAAAREAIAFLGAFLAGTLLTAALLPLLPFRVFAAKGFLLGLVWTAGATWLFPSGPLETVSSLFLFPAFSAFLAMNFTGASTFTSPTGALREVKMATPFLAGLALIGATLKLIAAGLALT